MGYRSIRDTESARCWKYGLKSLDLVSILCYSIRMYSRGRIFKCFSVSGNRSERNWRGGSKKIDPEWIGWLDQRKLIPKIGWGL